MDQLSAIDRPPFIAETGGRDSIILLFHKISWNGCSHMLYMYVFALTSSHLPTTHADLVLVEENTTYSDIFSVVSGFLKHLTRNMMSASLYQNMSGKRFNCTSLDL